MFPPVPERRVAAPRCAVVMTAIAVVAALTACEHRAHDAGTAPTAAPVARAAPVDEPAPRPPAGRSGTTRRWGWRPAAAAARAYARRRDGIVSFAVRRGRRSWSLRGHTPARSASTVKVLLLAAFLRGRAVRGRALGAGEASTLSAMITRSDNDAATSIYNLVGAERLAAVARRAGMRDFAAAPAWGVSRLTAADGARLMLRFERLVPRRHRARALSLLAGIVPWQRWGIADAVPRGWHLRFKGGWAPPAGSAPAVNHQLALLWRGRRRVAIAILTSGGSSQAYTSETQRGVAARLLHGLARH
jgi:hypothetical protein